MIDAVGTSHRGEDKGPAPAGSGDRAGLERLPVKITRA